MAQKGKAFRWLSLGLIIILLVLNVFQWLANPIGLFTPTSVTQPGPTSGQNVEISPSSPMSQPRLPEQPFLLKLDKTDQAVVMRYHQLFYESDNTWLKLHWLGIPTQQNPNDVWMHQEIISEVKPDFIVETGTAAGGSAVLWATILQQVNPKGRVITIDVHPASDNAQELPLAKERIDFLLGSSTSPEIVQQVKQKVQGGKVLLLLDSDHSKDHVLKEMQIYSPLVPVGSYMIVQDSNVNGNPVAPTFGPGPMEAIDAFLASTKDFVPDYHRERLYFTMHPKGYLKRVQ